MATSECGGEEKVTIRTLLRHCTTLQRELRGQLDKSFSRLPKSEEKTPSQIAPCLPNVLDDVMADLEGLIAEQKATIEFVITNINDKL